MQSTPRIAQANGDRYIRYRRGGAWTAAGFLALALSICGCGQQLGTFLYWSGLVPQPKVTPQFELTEGKVAILIDDKFGSLPSSDFIAKMHETLAAELTMHEACGPVVPYSKLVDLERRESEFDKMSIRQIGEKLGAEQVLHVTIESFGTGEHSEMGVLKGYARAAAKVCTTAPKKHVRLWPQSQMGQPVEVRRPTAQSEGTDHAAQYAESLCIRLSKRIAMLFYKHLEQAEKDLESGQRNE